MHHHVFECAEEIALLRCIGAAPIASQHETANRRKIERLFEQPAKAQLLLRLAQSRLGQLNQSAIGQFDQEDARALVGRGASKTGSAQQQQKCCDKRRRTTAAFHPNS